MMSERLVILLLLSLLLPAGIEAQQSARIARIGYLSAVSAEVDKNRLSHFQQRMQELGYREGKNIKLEQRYADGKFGKIPELVAELIQLRVDVLVVFGDTAILAAKNATSTIPIVMTLHPDPVGDGIIASLARPGGNVTGCRIFIPCLLPNDSRFFRR